MRVLIDTNVVLDFLQEREPFAENAVRLFARVDAGEVEGLTGGLSLNLGGISINALVISTATGFKSLPCASKPKRCASRGIEPPPQKGS